jgi:hypothetical protein
MIYFFYQNPEKKLVFHDKNNKNFLNYFIFFQVEFKLRIKFKKLTTRDLIEFRW